MKPRIGIFISGGGSNMVALLDAVDSGLINAEVALVLSDHPNAAGLTKARIRGYETICIKRETGHSRSMFEKALTDAIEPYRLDIICLAGFMKILSADFIQNWEGRILNIHPSLLPKYKGLNTHQRALNANDAQAGCTVHLVTSELDAGPILGQKSVPIHPGDTAQSLAERVLQEEHKLYPQILADFVEKMEGADIDE